MIASIKKTWQEKPLLLITILAIVIRLISLVFATGYGYHDDHFLVIRPAQSWLEGVDLNYMIVESEDGKISGRSILYPVLHFLLFGLLELLNISSPVGKMFVVRLLHLLLFTVGIRWAYRLSLLLTTEKHAKYIGIILAVFWMFPQISVRTLVEVVPIPLMMLASLYTVKYLRQSASIRYIWMAGMLLGVCFSLRYQTVFFAGGLGLALLITGKWKQMLVMALGVLIPIVLIHGIGDYFICDFPFCKIWYYVEYNIIYSQSYFTEPWYFYTLIILGVLLPPLSFFLFFGFIRAGKVDIVLWSGTLCFLIFHSLFPNKQERFIFTILPHMIILGYIGWKQFAVSSSFWQRKKKL
ncbi:MAG: mannosyltransferase, partial [Bacteroidota bacterium]